jgi:hypothetical protein
MPKKKRPEKEDPHLRHDLEYLKKHLDKLWEQAQDAADRLQDIEVHVNLLTRLLTAICIEKLEMRVGVLKRMIKKIEKEVIRESQIHHLESLYNMPHYPSGKPHHPKGESEHRWEDIS